MNLIPAALRYRLIVNAFPYLTGQHRDHFPLVKLFTPDGAAIWLLTELDPDDEDTAFGLCDLGVGCPELGTVRLSELRIMRDRMDLPVERALGFRADKPLSAYAAAARLTKRIVA